MLSKGCVVQGVDALRQTISVTPSWNIATLISPMDWSQSVCMTSDPPVALLLYTAGQCTSCMLWYSSTECRLGACGNQSYRKCCVRMRIIHGNSRQLTNFVRMDVIGAEKR